MSDGSKLLSNSPRHKVRRAGCDAPPIPRSVLGDARRIGSP